MEKAVTRTELAELDLFKKGKVRDIYRLEDGLLFIASDRISAFDSVLPTGIPDKGKVLSQLSVHWFNLTEKIIKNHIITDDVSRMPLPASLDVRDLAGRSLYVHFAEQIPFECIVRGYIAGSAWKEYQAGGEVCGIELPPGLQLAEKFPEPIFTPATKAEDGHDINVPYQVMVDRLGEDLAGQMRKASLELFTFATEYCEERELILTDTKFEFGLIDDKLVLIDEVFTPDSSRFWRMSSYKPGVVQDGLDKEFVRDYLREVKWVGEGPAPELPDHIVTKTRERYTEVFSLLTDRDFS